MAQDPQISSLKTQIEAIKKQPKSLSSDLSLADTRKKLSVAEAKVAKERWYGNENAENAGEAVSVEKPVVPVGLKIMDMLTMPLYGAAGVAKKAVGLAKDKSLLQAVTDNMATEKDTFGTVLQKLGVSRVVSAPLGIALDFAVGGVVDPFIGFGAGARYTSTFRRAVSGAKEAGVAGAVAGVKSGVMEKSAKMFGAVARKTEASKRLSGAALKATEKFESLTGKSVLEVIDENALRKWSGPNLDIHARDAFVKKFEGKKILGMWKPEDAWDFFVGERNTDWQAKMRMLEDMDRAGLIKNGKVIEASEFDDLWRKQWKDRLAQAMKRMDEAGDTSDDLHKYIDIGGDTIDGVLQKLDQYPAETRKPLMAIRDRYEEGLRTAMLNPDTMRARNSAQIFDRLVQEVETDKMLKIGLQGINDAKAKENGWDVMEGLKNYLSKKKVKLSESGEKGLANVANEAALATTKMSEILRGHFSTAVTGILNPATFAGSVLSNPTMAMAMGLKSWGNGKYWKQVWDAGKLIRGKTKIEAVEALKNIPEVGKFMDDYPELFERLFGFHPSSLSTQKIAMDALDSVKVGDRKLYDEILKIAGNEEKLSDEMLKMIESFTGEAKTKNKLGSFGTMMQKQLAKFEKTHGRAPTDAEMAEFNRGIGITSQTIDYGEMARYKSVIAEKARTEGGLWKAYDWYLTKPMEAYNLSDTMFRFGTWRHLIEDGIDSAEATVLSRFVPMTGDDFVDYVARDGNKYFRMKGEKAADVVGEMYMNYAAMPGYVKMLRSLPVVGSPFVSFSHGMAGKTLKTLLYNPEAFSKLNVVLKDISKVNTPAEEAALETKYASYLKNDPMQHNIGRLPFFAGNPVFASFRQVNPFVSSIFQPSQRQWEDTIGGNVGKSLDSLPIFKTPLGSMLLTSLILPLFSEEGKPVQNM
ncbi:MAG: hypothetical protein WC346_11625, partial [Methanogenium sp.]